VSRYFSHFVVRIGAIASDILQAFGASFPTKIMTHDVSSKIQNPNNIWPVKGIAHCTTTHHPPQQLIGAVPPLALTNSRTNSQSTTQQNINILLIVTCLNPVRVHEQETTGGTHFNPNEQQSSSPCFCS